MFKPSQPTRFPSPQPKSRPHILILTIVILLFLTAGCLWPGSAEIGARNEPLGSVETGERVVHVVLVQFKKGVAEDAMNITSRRLLGLKDICLHPVTQEPYILSFKGGKNNSPEGFDRGMTHAFIAEFASAEDRDYYVSRDPLHEAFKRTLAPILERLVVLDFVPGVL